MALLPRIQEPADLRSLTADELQQLAAEIREFIVNAVSNTGGHLGSNLGAVELSIALHRVFDSPQDRKSTRLNSSHIPLSRMPSSA